MIAEAKKPVILAGVELHRFGVTDLALKLAKRANIPIASDLLSKSAVAENHPLYLGVYGGAMSSDPAVRQYVESSDCVLMLGTFITDMSMGIYTAKLDRSHTILATTEKIDVRLSSLRRCASSRIILRCGSRRRGSSGRNSSHPSPHAEPQAAGEIGADGSAGHAGRSSGLFRCIWMRTAAWFRMSGTGCFGAIGIRTSTAGGIHRAGVLPVDGVRGAGIHRREHGQSGAAAVCAGGGWGVSDDGQRALHRGAAGAAADHADAEQ